MPMLSMEAQGSDGLECEKLRVEGVAACLAVDGASATAHVACPTLVQKVLDNDARPKCQDDLTDRCLRLKPSLAALLCLAGHLRSGLMRPISLRAVEAEPCRPPRPRRS